jgi:hypothetical protein
MPHLKSMNGRSQRLLTRDRRERAMNTRCAEGVHGCPEASWGTLNSCCGSLRRKAQLSVDAIGPDWQTQIMVGNHCLLCLERYTCTWFYVEW